MTIDWEKTSWGSLEKWQIDASDWGCPVANEYHGELPSSEESRFQVFATNCEKGCALNAEPDPPWEACPFWKEMAEEFLAIE